MNIIKSIFISLLIPLLAVSTLYSLNNIFEQGPKLINLGLLATCMPLLLFFANALIFRKQARTSKNLNVVSILAILGLLTVLSTLIAKGEKPTEVLSFSLFAVINLLGALFYIHWYSKLDRNTNSPLMIGERLPNFNIYQDGSPVSSDSFIGQPTVYMFYRGNWCPFCVAHIKELVDTYQSAIHDGIRFVLVSPQPDKNTQALAEKFEVPFTFATDRNNSAAKSLGILHKNGLPSGLQALGYDSDTVLPTIIVVERDGTVTYLDLTDNYRIRPEIGQILKIALTENNS